MISKPARWAAMRARAIFVVAAACFVAAAFLPFWKLTLFAPQYPGNLRVWVGVFGLGGDVREVNGLNHYIGMRPLDKAAIIELAIAPWGMAAFTLIALAAAFTRKKWLNWALLLPIGFPLIFLTDVSFWLWYFGNNLDPHAALNRSVAPFTPVVLFWSHVGQFSVYAMVQAGFAVCTAGSVMCLAGLLLRRREASAPEVSREAGADSDKPVRSGATTSSIAAAGVLVAGALLFSASAAHAFDLQAAIDRAPPGGEVRIPPGVHRGQFVVKHPVTLAPAGPPGSAILDGGGRGCVLRVMAPDTTVRDLRIRGSGIVPDVEDCGIVAFAPRTRIERNDLEDVLFGISLRGAPDSVLRGNRIVGKDLPLMRRADGIKLWGSPNTLIERNVMVRTSDLVIWYSAHVTIRDNVARDSRYGIHFMYSSGSLIEGNTLIDNRVGAFLMNSKRLVFRNNLIARNRGPSGYGLGLKDIDGITITGNRFVANRVGLYATNSPTELGITHEIRDNLFAYNDIGMAFLPDVERNVFIRNSFIENGQQAVVWGGGGFTGNTFTQDGRGNYWSDYVGWDAARDGVGDVPYRMNSLFDAWEERDPRLRLFRGGLAAWAIDFAARMFPVFRPDVRVVDTGPLTSPVRVPAGPTPPAPGSSAPVTLASLALAAAAVLLARPLRLGAGRRTPPTRE